MTKILRIFLQPRENCECQLRSGKQVELMLEKPEHKQKSKFVVLPGFCVDFDSHITRYVSINCPVSAPKCCSFGFKCTSLQLRFAWSLVSLLLLSDFSNCSWPHDPAPPTRPSPAPICH